MAQQQYIALIGDLVSSRSVSDSVRHQLQETLTWNLDEIPLKWESGFKALPQVTLGDEFQSLFHADSVGVEEMLVLITQIQERVRPTAVRFGIGVGSLSTSPKSRALGMDGPCFHRAREALTRARSAGLPCQLVIDGEATDSLWGALASYALRQRQNWTDPQREAIDRYSSLGTWKDVAISLGITPGAVSLRQRTAEWPLFNMAWSALESGLIQMIGGSTDGGQSNRWHELMGSYPLSLTCFAEYLSWLENNKDVVSDDNDLISALEMNRHDRLDRLEKLLVDSRNSLGMSDKRFRKAFFDDLLTVNPEVVHDALAEPLFVLDLVNHGFTEIRKLPRSFKDGHKRIAAADFTAKRSGKKYAIELKSIRPEDKPKPQPEEPTGNSSIPYWWGAMLRNNILTKIEAKKHRALEQLRNTMNARDCDGSILAIYTRRLGPSALMEHEDYVRELADIKGRYSLIDHIIVKDYFGRIIIHPEFEA